MIRSQGALLAMHDIYPPIAGAGITHDRGGTHPQATTALLGQHARALASKAGASLILLMGKLVSSQGCDRDCNA